MRADFRRLFRAGLKARNLTLYAFCKQYGFSFQQLTQYLYQNRRELRTNNMEAILNALGTDWGRVIFTTTNPKRSITDLPLIQEPPPAEQKLSEVWRKQQSWALENKVDVSKVSTDPIPLPQPPGSGGLPRRKRRRPE